VAPSAAPASAAPSAAEPSAAAPSTAAPSAAASASSGTAALCVDVAKLRASIVALKDLKLLQVGTAGVKAALTDVKNNAEALKVSAAATFRQPLDDLLTAVNGLLTTVTNLGDQSSLGAAAVSIKTSIDQIGTAAAALETAASSTCPTM
jgi:hypothetical protein